MVATTVDIEPTRQDADELAELRRRMIGELEIFLSGTIGRAGAGPAEPRGVYWPWRAENARHASSLKVR